MADRFPSIEDIDAGQTQVRPDSAAQGDFLARERAALGDDADLFSTNDTTQTRKATIEDDDEDLLGGGDDGFTGSGAPHGSNTFDDLDDFESAFPAVSTQNNNVGPGGTITNTAAPFQGSGFAPNTTPGTGYTNYVPEYQTTSAADSEPIKAWRSARDTDLTRRDEASERRKHETVETAQKDVDSFYETYNRKIEKQKQQVQKEAEEFLNKREDTTAGGTAWERIAKLVDLSGKGQVGGGDGSTKKRMREMLVALKADKDAPGAAGI